MPDRICDPESSPSSMADGTTVTDHGLTTTQSLLGSLQVFTMETIMSEIRRLRGRDNGDKPRRTTGSRTSHQSDKTHIVPDPSEFEETAKAAGQWVFERREQARSHVENLFHQFEQSHAGKEPTFGDLLDLGGKLNGWATVYSQDPGARVRNLQTMDDFGPGGALEGDPGAMRALHKKLVTEMFGEIKKPHQPARSSDDQSLISRFVPPVASFFSGCRSNLPH